MELMREACKPYDWSRARWKLLIGEQMLLDPKQGGGGGGGGGESDAKVMYKDELGRTVGGVIYVSTFQLRFYPCLLYTSPSPRDRG